MADLKGTKLKLGRAKQHLDQLESEIADFIAGKPYTFTARPGEFYGEYLLVASANREVPEHWSLVIGDFAHNARSALDVLVGGISTLPPSDPKRRKTQFPIMTNAESFTETAKRLLLGVSELDIAKISAEQPFVSGVAPHPLHLLAELNNADKHRYIAVVGAVGREPTLELSGPAQISPGFFMGGGMSAVLSPGLEVNMMGLKVAAIGDGVLAKGETPVASIRFPGEEPSIHAECAVDIEFGSDCEDVKGLPVLQVLRAVYSHVDQVIAKFS